MPQLLDIYFSRTVSLSLPAKLDIISIPGLNNPSTSPPSKEMSATATNNSIAISMQQTLADYKLHVSGETDTNSLGSTIENVPSKTTQVSNPHSWPRRHNRIPNYRPINRNNMDSVERPNGSNGAEKVFITIMFTGVATNAVSFSQAYDGIPHVRFEMWVYTKC